MDEGQKRQKLRRMSETKIENMGRDMADIVSEKELTIEAKKSARYTTALFFASMVAAYSESSHRCFNLVRTVQRNFYSKSLTTRPPVNG